jgi:putative ABC transport system permease protein
LVLLIGAGFMVKTFQRLLTNYYGYDPKNLLTLQVSLPRANYGEDARIVPFYDRVLQELQVLPGARASAISSDGAVPEHLYIEGQPALRPGDPRPEVKPVSAGYLPSMRIPLREGRFVSEKDRPESRRVTVISASVARRYWPHSDPVGHRIKLGNSQAPWLTIVGVCGDVVDDWFTGKPSLTAYIPYTQAPNPSAMFLIRAAGDPIQLATAARADIRKIDKDLPVYDVKTMQQSLSEQTSGVRAAANTMSMYAIIAVLLAATGIFAVISYFVVQRTHDIGVRMALGADAGDVLRMTFRRTARLTITGLLIGIPAALALSKLMSSLLYNIVKLDWTTFGSCVAMLGAVALLASYIPARRATKIDPIIALRQE